MLRSMKLWTVVLLLGVAVLVVYPFLTGSPADAAEVGGFWPQALIPVGYALAVVGAAGIFTAWVLRRRID